MHSKMTLREKAKNISSELRRNQTPTEKLLWKRLRKKQFHGYKFLRQHSIFYEHYCEKRFFIADFYCSELRLIVEVDGGIHEQQKDYDQIRTEILEMQKGLRIIRFENKKVIKDMNNVLQKLELFSNPSHPSLQA
jgi:very-short-patch-repair endonuclease